MKGGVYVAKISPGVYSGDFRIYPFALQPVEHGDIINKLFPVVPLTPAEKAEYLRACVRISFFYSDMFNEFKNNYKADNAGTKIKVKHSRRGRPAFPPSFSVSLTAHKYAHKDIIDKLEPLDDRSDHIRWSIRFSIRYPELLLDFISPKVNPVKQLAFDLTGT